MIYAGQGVHYAQAWAELKRLAELLAAPVTTSLGGKSAFPENHQLALGSGGRSIPSAVHHFLQNADLIFGIGCSFTETNFGVDMPAGKTIIHATLDPIDLNKDVVAADALIGDARLTLEALQRGGRATGSKHRRATAARSPPRSQTVRMPWLAQWQPKLTSDEAPLSPYRVIRDLAQHGRPRQHDHHPRRRQPARPALARSGRRDRAAQLHRLGQDHAARLRPRPRHGRQARASRTSSASTSGATPRSASPAWTSRPRCASAFPILSILLNNFSMAIELKVMPVSTEKYRSTDISGDYAAMARAFGGYGERVTEPGEIIPAIKRGIAQTRNGTPALLEFITCKETEISVF